MLSPHEFATLMLVNNAFDQIELDRAELDILLARQLVVLKQLGAAPRFQITRRGEYLLKQLSEPAARVSLWKTRRNSFASRGAALIDERGDCTG
jgi:hypothetical protein